MDEVFDLSLKEFILWIRSKKKETSSFVKTRLPSSTLMMGGDSYQGTAPEAGPLQVHVQGFKHGEETSSCSHFLTSRQPGPITLGPFSSLGKPAMKAEKQTTSRGVAQLTALPQRLLENGKICQDTGAGERVFPKQDSPNIPEPRFPG